MNEIWTIKKTLAWGTNYFDKNGVESPRLNIEHLLAEILQKKRIELYVEFDRQLNPKELASLKESIQRRVKKEPLQYILGYVEFSDLTFTVRPEVLIPRPETELLVEKLTAIIKDFFIEQNKIRIVDLGVGSGCIGLSLIKPFFQAELIGVDVSQEALSLARENAEANELTERAQFLKGSWLAPLKEKSIEPVDLIVSNPPYVTEAEFQDLQPEVKDFEPKLALVSGETGLEMYEQIIPEAKDHLKENGMLAFEVGMGQSEKVKNLMEANGFKDVEVTHDLNNIDRIVIGKK